MLVAEVMLQQTRVDTVIPYFERWMRRFPDLASLAAAETDEVLRHWQGLGYYRRASRLHRLARLVVAEHGGALPASRLELADLPGVGPYSAAAVAALGYGLDAIAVDANVRRVAARLFAWVRLPPDREVEKALLGRLAGRPEPVATGAPWAALSPAEALIEVGALLCTPRSPRCTDCPLRPWCAAAASGTPSAFPVRRPRRPPPHRRRFALVAVDGDRVWLRRRGSEEMLAGLWGFPQSREAPEGGRCLASLLHGYSHFRLELVIALVPPDHPDLARAAGTRAHRLAELPRLPLSKVDQRVLEKLRQAALLSDPAVS